MDRRAEPGGWSAKEGIAKGSAGSERWGPGPAAALFEDLGGGAAIRVWRAHAQPIAGAADIGGPESPGLRKFTALVKFPFHRDPAFVITAEPPPRRHTQTLLLQHDTTTSPSL